MSLVICGTLFISTGNVVDSWKCGVIFRKLVHKVPKGFLAALISGFGDTDTIHSNCVIDISTVSAIIGKG
jgi:hypothetical protein